MLCVWLKFHYSFYFLVFEEKNSNFLVCKFITSQIRLENTSGVDPETAMKALSMKQMENLLGKCCNCAVLSRYFLIKKHLAVV